MKYPLKSILKNFLNYVDDLETHRTLGEDQYEVQFQKLKHLTDVLKFDPDYPCTHGLKDINRPKNRYKDIVPYDFCRVILPDHTGVPGSDYVNASHVKGVSGAFAYIAAQAPLPNTVIDFWKMIWICEVQVVVMACNEREGGKTKCELYWPEAGEIKKFGSLSVEFHSQTQICPDFLVRSLVVRQDTELREIFQFHYTSWPDHGVPDSVEPIIELVRLVRGCQASETSPILVHCSAGCGRTGTICAIDFIWAYLRTGKLTENFCLYDIVAEMRRQRIAMVQTKEQYELVYRAVTAMFEQQLRLIDSHTYENLDRDGTPLPWTNRLMENGFGTDLQISSVDKTTHRAESSGDKTIEKESSSLDSVKPIGTNNVISLKNDSVNTPKCSLDAPKCSLDVHDLHKLTSSECAQNDVESAEDERINARSLVLSSPESADSIPFIDDDDTKSDIQVRARCGRAYLHIPSCDSISKIVDCFDPFVDKVWTGTGDNSPVNVHYHSLPASIAGQTSPSDNSSIVSGFDNPPDPLWVKRQSVEAECHKAQPIHKLAKNANGSDVNFKAEDDSVVTPEVKSPKFSFSRRPSIVKLKGFFEKSSKTKSGARSSLFRHHTHHFSRAESAPPSLNSMKRNSDTERESIFALVTRKFRSSSVKSAHELQKETATTSHLSTLKRSAATSLSSFKQNLSSFSRSLPFGKCTKAQRASPLVSHDSRVNFEPTHTETKNNPMIELPRSIANETSKKSHTHKLPPSFNYSEGRESLQQKFVVNVLSTNHGQNTLPAKKSVFQMTADKPSSPKPRRFMSDFECLKTNPVRLLSRNLKNNGVEPSCLWYSDEQSEIDDVKSDVSSSDKTKNSSVSNVLTKNNPFGVQSTFYTDFDRKEHVEEKVLVNSLPLPEKVGSSQFFWPVNSMDSKKFNDLNSVKTKKSDVMGSNGDISSDVKMDQVVISEMIAKFSSDKIVEKDSSSVACDEGRFCFDSPKHPKTTFANAFEIDEITTSVPESTRLLMDLDSNSTGNTIEASKHRELLVNLSEPPALPKKTVIGKNKQITMLLGGHRNISNLELVQNDLVKIEPPPPPEVKKPILKSDTAHSSNNSLDLYINVNIVAKKNIEQIESTLRNHPRGAIIDLTSRQSYSMEEELTNALDKLSEPVEPPKELNKKIPPGYEKIWPDTVPVTSPKNDNEDEFNKNFLKYLENKSFGDRNAVLTNNKKKSGLCYSPPLRRSAASNFPVLKSRSCASLDWPKESQNDTNFLNDHEKSSDSSEMLVNEAVVEFSTMLDELTTKTLTEDLSSNILHPKKQDESLKQGTNASEVRSSPVPEELSKIGASRKYETIYLPQKQALSIKHGDEEEIIFHFPPPPPLPPPPTTESIAESFDIYKEGIIHLPRNQKIDIDSNTDFDLLEADLSEEQSVKNSIMPVPIPRKTKHCSTNELIGLKKSASYSTLSPPKLKASGLDDVFDRPQTLPRSQLPEEYPASQENLDQSLNRDASVDTRIQNNSHSKSPHSTSKYETIFPHTCLISSKQTKHQEYGELVIVQTEKEALKVLGGKVPNETSFQRSNTNPEINVDCRKSHTNPSKYLWHANNPTTSNAENSDGGMIHLPQIMHHQMHRKSSDSLKSSLNYRDIEKSPSAFPRGSLKNKEHLLNPSKKRDPAPPPPPATFPPVAKFKGDGTSRKPASRKSERAPDPPPLHQKSQSLRLNSPRVHEKVESNTIPTYAIVKRHKLPSVLENLADSQGNSRTYNLSSGKYVSGNLQHSQSDASVFLDLRMQKYQRKTDSSVDNSVLSNLRLSSDSSSDSDASFRLLNTPGEQRPVFEQNTAMPVAPPRSRRRNTIEVTDIEENASVTSYLSGTSKNDATPNLPMKTKEAFEIPEEFRVQKTFKSRLSPRREYPQLTSKKEKRTML